MTLEQLRVLKAIVEHGTLKQAASSLHKTQPAVTMAIKKLEQQLGFDLFDRQQYRIRLTERGKLFYQEAEVLLHDAEQLSSLGKELSRGNEASFAISYEQLCATAEINQRLISAFRAFPGTRFNVGGAGHVSVHCNLLSMLKHNWELDHGFTYFMLQEILKVSRLVK